MKFKAKDSENAPTPLYEYLYDVGVDYDVIAINDILDIHKYIMKNHDIK